MRMAARLCRPALEGVRTVVIPTNAHAVAFGTAPLANAVSGAAAISGAALNQALAIKRQMARRLMAKNPAFFGVGVGQSLDNPREAALVIYVDRTRIPRTLPADHRRPAHPLHDDGAPARDALLRDDGAVFAALPARSDSATKTSIRKTSTGRFLSTCSDPAVPRFQDFAARSISAISILTMFIMACIALGCLISSIRRAGVICQDKPNLSISQPHWISLPPADSFSQ